MLLPTSGGFVEALGGSYNPRFYNLTTKNGTVYLLDEVEGLKRITDRNGNTIDLTASGIVSSTGITLPFNRDPQGRITGITEPSEGIAAPAQVRYTYDAAGDLVSSIDQSGAETKYFYEDPRFPHYLTRIQDPLTRPLTRNVYGADGRLVATCAADGNVTTLAGCERFESDAVAARQVVTNPRGFRTEFLYDERGNVLREKRWLDASRFLEIVRTYDASNNMESERDAAGNVRKYSYDARGNLLSETDPGGRTIVRAYNSCNQVASETDPGGSTTKYTYDTNCNLRFVEDAEGGKTEYRYDSRGARTDMIDPVGSHWKWTYDSAGRLHTMSDPFGKIARFGFTAAGDLIWRVDRMGRRTEFEYDAAHRLRYEKWRATPDRVLAYTYNQAGELRRAEDPAGSLELSYNAAGNLSQVSTAFSPTAVRVQLAYDYDHNGNVTRVEDSLGGLTEYSYDALDRLIRVQQSGSGLQPKRADMLYNDAGLLVDLRRYSDVAAATPAATTTYEYECSGCAERIAAIRHRRPTAQIFHELTFSRDARGDIRAMTDAEGMHDYSYDAARRLRSATHSRAAVQPYEMYTYDAAGNRTSSHLSRFYAYSYQTAGSGNRLLEDEAFTYVYDDEGNLVRRTEKQSGSYTEYTYDFRNRMIGIVSRAVTGQIATEAAYDYDLFNRRIRGRESGQTLVWTYDMHNPVHKLTSSGAIISRRMYGRALDSILAEEAGNLTRWFITDQVGTVRDVLAPATGQTDHYVYDSFGQLRARTRSGPGNDLLFTSREFAGGDTNVTLGDQMGYFRLRYYSPLLGRFFQEDMLEPFKYSYADNNPLLMNDPTGAATTAEYKGTWWSRVATRMRGPCAGHHVFPKYMIGFDNGIIARVPVAYHVMIHAVLYTFLPWNQGPISQAQAMDILNFVYKMFPLIPCK